MSETSSVTSRSGERFRTRLDSDNHASLEFAAAQHKQFSVIKSAAHAAYSPQRSHLRPGSCDFFSISG